MRKWLMLLSVLPSFIWAEIAWQAADLPSPFLLTINVHPEPLSLSHILEIEVTMNYPTSYQSDTSALIAQLAGSVHPLAPQWKLLDTHISSLPAKEGIRAEHFSARLTPLMTGKLELSLLRISFSSKVDSNSSVSTLTPIFSINVLPIPANVDTLALAPLLPLEPQFPLELTQANRELFLDNPVLLQKNKEMISTELARRSFPWLACTILLACAGVGWTLYVTRDRWPKRAPKLMVEPSPKQQMEKILQALQRPMQQPNLTSADDTEIASLVLKALGIRLKVDTTKLTTLEVVQAMQQSPSLPPQVAKNATTFLREMDQIKFSGESISQTATKNRLQQAQVLVQELIESSTQG